MAAFIDNITKVMLSIPVDFGENLHWKPGYDLTYES